MNARYEKGTTSRLAATLQIILRPPSFPGDALGFESALKDCELLVTTWQTMADERLSDAVKRQILEEQAPRAIKMQLLMESLIDYDDMRSTVFNYVVTARDKSAALKS